MTTSNNPREPFTASFIETDPNGHLELINTTDQQLKCIEILTVFLTDDESPTGPSRAHIKFEDIGCIQPEERVVLSHRTWIDGKPAAPEDDQVKRLQKIAGESRPYVLDVSWEDAYGKSRYQRIPVGH